MNMTLLVQYPHASLDPVICTKPIITQLEYQVTPRGFVQLVDDSGESFPYFKDWDKYPPSCVNGGRPQR